MAISRVHQGMSTPSLFRMVTVAVAAAVPATQGDDGAAQSVAAGPVVLDAADDTGEQVGGDGAPGIAAGQGVVQAVLECAHRSSSAFGVSVVAMARRPRCRCVLTELTETPSVSAISGTGSSR